MGNNISASNESCQGLALILGYDNYEDPKTSPRLGNQVDLQRLDHILPQFGFHVEICRNFTAKSTKNKILEVATSELYSRYSCLLVIVLTHGTYGGALQAYDDFFYTNDVWGPFTDCNNFNGKTKIQLFQACRGALQERVMKLGDSLPSSNTMSQLPYICLPELPRSNEFFIAYSSHENTVSVSNKQTGSWYVETLCAELSSICRDVSLETILTRVTYMLVNRAKVGYAQTAAFISLLSTQLKINTSCMGFPNNLVHSDDPALSSMGSDTQDCVSVMKRSESDLDLTTDGYGGKTSVVNIPDYYPSRASSTKTGRALIFYTSLYQNDAELMKQTLATMQFDVEVTQLIEGDSFINTLLDVSKQPSLSDANSLLVAILGPILSPVPGSQESHVAGKLISSTWSPFIATNCLHLQARPKIFLYLDNLDTTDSSSEKKKEDEDWKLESPESTFGRNVTDHVDFLHVIGFGRVYFNSLLEQLETVYTNEQDMFEILASAKHAAISRCGDVGTLMTSQGYFKSTLSLGLKFDNFKEKKTDDVTNYSASAVDDRKENFDSKVDEVAFKVDREVNRALGDVNEAVETIADVLPRVEEQLVVHVPKIRQSLSRIRDLWRK